MPVCLIKLVSEHLQVYVGGIHLRVEIAARLVMHVACRDGHGVDAVVAGIGPHPSRIRRRSPGRCRWTRTLLQPSCSAVRAMASGVAWSASSRSCATRDVPVIRRICTQVQPAVPNDRMLLPIRMVERLFLDRVDTEVREQAGGFVQRHCMIDAPAHEACAALAFVQLAVASVGRTGCGRHPACANTWPDIVRRC